MLKLFITCVGKAFQGAAPLYAKHLLRKFCVEFSWESFAF